MKLEQKEGFLGIFLAIIAVVGLSLFLALQVLKYFPKLQAPSALTEGEIKAKFTIGPTQPTCHNGQECDRPYADKPIEIYHKDNRSLVTKKNTNDKGILAVSLPQGNYYLVTGEDLGIEKRQKEISFVIVGGQTTKADIQIDTGIR